MIIGVERSFDKDVSKIRNKKLLHELRNIISVIEDVDFIHEIPHTKKIEGYKSYYRVKLGDYRLGIEKVSNQEVKLIRFLHRKEIYRYFPR